MANESVKRFVANLFAACPNYRVGREEKQDAARLYVEKLSKWRLPADAWSRALSRLVADGDGGLPPLGVIYRVLKDCQARSVDSLEVNCLSFTIGGKHYVLGRNTGRIDPYTKKEIWEVMPIDPANPPAAPAGAENVRLVIAPKQQAPTVPCENIAESRGAFLRGWTESGADPEKCMEMFALITAKERD